MDILKRFQKMTVPMVCALIIGYFFIYGMRGKQEEARLVEEIKILQQEYDLLHERRLDHEKHVALLKPRHINPDYLDEKSREILGLIHPDEVVIKHSDK